MQKITNKQLKELGKVFIRTIALERLKCPKTLSGRHKWVGGKDWKIEMTHCHYCDMRKLK